MRAVRYHDGGEPAVLRVEECERPEPERDEVLIEMRAASINPVDAKLREQGAPRLPKTTGSDIAGIVAAVGTDVDDYEAGDRVFATGLHVGRFAGGAFADFATVPTDLVATLPDGVSFEEGAAVALVGVTVWRAMIHHARLEPGETAFIHGGNGGVGHVAVGLANALGARAVSTARPTYHDDVRRLGAETVLDYTRDDLPEAAIEATGGADVVLDPMAGTYLETDIEIAGYNGDVSIIAGEEAALSNLSAARSKEIDIHMMSMSNLATHSDAPNIGPILERFGRLIAEDRLEVVIDRTYPLADAIAAHRAVMEDSFLGKIVLTP